MPYFNRFSHMQVLINYESRGLIAPIITSGRYLLAHVPEDTSFDDHSPPNHQNPPDANRSVTGESPLSTPSTETTPSHASHSDLKLVASNQSITCSLAPSIVTEIYAPLQTRSSESLPSDVSRTSSGSASEVTGMTASSRGSPLSLASLPPLDAPSLSSGTPGNAWLDVPNPLLTFPRSASPSRNLPRRTGPVSGYIFQKSDRLSPVSEKPFTNSTDPAARSTARLDCMPAIAEDPSEEIQGFPTANTLGKKTSIAALRRAPTRDEEPCFDTEDEEDRQTDIMTDHFSVDDEHYLDPIDDLDQRSLHSETQDINALVRSLENEQIQISSAQGSYRSRPDLLVPSTMNDLSRPSSKDSYPFEDDAVPPPIAMTRNANLSPSKRLSQQQQQHTIHPPPSHSPLSPRKHHQTPTHRTASPAPPTTTTTPHQPRSVVRTSIIDELELPLLSLPNPRPPETVRERRKKLQKLPHGGKALALRLRSRLLMPFSSFPALVEDSGAHGSSRIGAEQPAASALASALAVVQVPRARRSVESELSTRTFADGIGGGGG